LANEQRVKSLLCDKGIDVSLITSSENIYYLSEYRSPLHPFMGTVTMVVFPTEGSASLVVDVCEGLGPFQTSKIDDIWFYDEFYYHFSGKLTREELRFEKAYDTYSKKGMRDLLSVLKENLEGQAFRPATIGIEQTMPVFLRDSLQRILPNAKFKDVTPIFQEVRMIKTDEEIARLRDAAKINERALKAAIDAIHVGAHEWELVMAYREELDRHKAEPVYHLIAAGRGSGDVFPKYNLAHRLERGEIVYLDVGCRANGYCSDVSRSVVLGELPPSHERIRQSVLDGYWSTINTLRPGVGIREVFKNAIDMVRRAGIPDFMRSNVGHGIGLSIHELPDMVSSSSGLLEKDMVLNIETPYHGIGIGGFQQEDTARITHGGVELLTKLDRDVRLPA